ncbi:aminopeptidase [Candidatus Bathyarchaeota archaeon]|nr:aminopeptidase [Candidatus Bathyarchaeota archaeon]
MIEKKKLVDGVVNMFKVNMGLKKGEKIVVVTDVPTAEEWKTKDSEKLTEAITRSLLAKMVSEIAAEKFPDSKVDFFVYPSVGKHGTYPGKEVEEKMKSADVAIAITTYSLTHTDARVNACKVGTRVASMPMFLAEMFYPGGPMAADYREIDKETKKIADLMTKANEAKITSPGGTDITFSLKGRNGMVDAGIFTEKGAWGNLPSGEAYCAPVEGTANGKLVVEPNWYPDLKEKMTLVFKNGYVTEITGGGKVGDEFRSLLDFSKKTEPYISRRNLAELGVGTNPNAKRPDNVLESEKIKGTVHLAIGDNSHMGGKVSSDLHQDFIIPKPTMIFDGKKVMQDGKLLV